MTWLHVKWGDAEARHRRRLRRHVRSLDRQDRFLSLVCKLRGHKTPGVHKFSGVILCGRCYRQTGRWR